MDPLDANAVPSRQASLPNDAAHESVLSGFSVAHLVYFAGLAIVVAACLWLYEVRQQRSALEALA
ncbi:MAG: hypothetical protein AAF499_15490, partial [Pseudomonadota bacterium]